MKRAALALLLALLALPAVAAAQTRQEEATDWLWEEIAEHVYRLEGSFSVDYSPYADVFEKTIQSEGIANGMVYCMGVTNYTMSHDLKRHIVSYTNVSYMPGFTILQKINYGMEMTADEERLLNAAAKVSRVAWTLETDLQKERYIHDWIIKNVEYRWAESNDSIYNNAYGALLYGAGECDAYADAFCLLAGLSGLRVAYQPGKANGNEHMWNAVRLSDPTESHVYWHMVDVCFDDYNIPGRADACMYTYFNFGLDRMGAHSFNKNQCYLPYKDTMGHAYFFGNTEEDDFGPFWRTYDDAGWYINQHRRDKYIYFLVDQPYSKAALDKGIERSMSSWPAYRFYYEEVGGTTSFVFWFE